MSSKRRNATPVAPQTLEALLSEYIMAKDTVKMCRERELLAHQETVRAEDAAREIVKKLHGALENDL